MASAPRVAAKPTVSKIPVATGGRAEFGRKRGAEQTAGDAASSAAPATGKRAKAVPAPKTPPKAIPAPKTPPKAPGKPASKAAGKAKAEALAKATSRAVSLTPAARGAGSGDALDAHLERLGVGTGTAQAPTCVWTSRKGGKLYLGGLPMTQMANRFPKVALQICCFPNGPESRGGVTLAGAQLMTFSAAYSHERAGQWAEVWPAIKNTLWHGDNVLIHCIKGRHRGAYLAILTRALLNDG